MKSMVKSAKTLISAALPGPVGKWRRWKQQQADTRAFLRHLRPTDVFVVGHPKSGNTWLAYMLAIALQGDDRGGVTLANIGEYVPWVHGRDPRIAEYERLPDPRIFRNENPRFPLRYPRTVYLTRDPRAVLASYFDMHNTIFADRPMSFHAFLDEYLAHGCIRHWERVARWDRQVELWLKRAARDARVMVLRYEDMAADRAREVRRVLHFIGSPQSEDRLALAVARGSFEEMRRNEEQHGAESYPGEIGKRGRFIRRGKTDGWRDEIDQAAVQRIVTEFAPAMALAGYL